MIYELKLWKFQRIIKFSTFRKRIYLHFETENNKLFFIGIIKIVKCQAGTNFFQDALFPVVMIRVGKSGPMLTVGEPCS